MNNTNNANTTMSNQPRAQEIRYLYGDMTRMNRSFGVSNQEYCAENMASAVENKMPNLARFIAAYGKENIAAILGAHITDLMASLGVAKDMSDRDVLVLSRAICNNNRLRMLLFSTVVGFFHLLKVGDIEMYGKPTPRGIIEALNRYAERASVDEQRLKKAKNERDRDAEYERHRAESITWEQYCALHNLGGISPMLYLQQLLAADRLANAAITPQ